MMSNEELYKVFRDFAKGQVETAALMDALIEDYAEVISNSELSKFVVIDRIRQKAHDKMEEAEKIMDGK